MITLRKLRPYTGDMVAPSPNHGARKVPVIKGIVLHATADEGNEALSLSWLRSPKSRASCHLLVSRTGRVTRLVGDRQRAWHAGRARWRGTSDVNSVTLGIEIANRNDGEAYTTAQYRRVADIVAHYCRQGLSLDDVIGHGEIAGARRTDPFGWNWDRFRANVQRRLRAADGSRSVPKGGRPGVRAELVPDVPVVMARTVASMEPRVPVIAASAIAPSAIATAKPARASRTLWLAGATVLASSGMIAADALDLALRIGVTLPEHLTKWALLAIGLVNIVLRLRARRPLECSSSGDDSAPAAPAVALRRGRGARPVPG